MASYGVTRDGRVVVEHELRGGGLVLRFLDFGGIVTAIEAPDRAGRIDNVVLGLPGLAAYEARNEHYRFGAIIGRYAGRIAGARFTIDGREVRLAANEGPNALHGGAGPGFDARLWAVDRHGADAATLRLASPDGDQGFPGRLDVAVSYRLLPDAALRIDFEARADAATMLNLTNHSYFNLAGAGAGDVRDHRLRLFAARIAEVDAAGIPTGGLCDLAGTPFDFRESRPIGARLQDARPIVTGFAGYNHSWMIDGADGRALRPAARLCDPVSGRLLDVATSEPSIHVYTANHFDGTDMGAAGIPLCAWSGIAFETQHLPDSPNRPAFPSTALRPGETFRSTSLFRFGILS
jgi:aldose 1-epimerase